METVITKSAEMVQVGEFIFWLEEWGFVENKDNSMEGWTYFNIVIAENDAHSSETLFFGVHNNQQMNVLVDPA